eukprot:2746538-Karenia_brevis.AAC.1
MVVVYERDILQTLEYEVIALTTEPAGPVPIHMFWTQRSISKECNNIWSFISPTATAQSK